MHLSLHKKLIAANTLTYILMLVVAGWFWMLGLNRAYDDSFEKRMDSQTTMFANAFGALLVTRDENNIAELFAILSRDTAVTYIGIEDTENVIRYEQNVDQQLTPNNPIYATILNMPTHYTVRAKIVKEGEFVGYLVIKAHNMEALDATVDVVTALSILVSVAFVIVGFLGALLLRRIIVPIETLAAQVRQVDETGDYSLRIEQQAGDEVGALATVVNDMLSTIENQEKYLENQVRERTKELRHQAFHDPLTNLRNRRGLHAKLDDIYDRKCDQNHGLLLLDLDQFKLINDTCGHLAGDALLVALAEQLRTHLGKEGDAARVGGDEFAVLLYNVDQDSLRVKADQIRNLIDAFYVDWEGVPLNVGVSIGAIIFNPSQDPVSGLLRHADAACFAAKDLGRNRVHYIAKDAFEDDGRHQEMVVVQTVLRALKEDQFELHSQPIKSLVDADESPQEEVLLRLKDEDGTLIYPNDFLRTAERYGAGVRVDSWVFTQIVRRLIDKLAKGEPCPIYWLNISSPSLVDEKTIGIFSKTLQKWPNLGRHLTLEITETNYIYDLEKVSQQMSRLKPYGLKFALDDFGSGASSYSYIRELPLDYIKIDGSFVQGINDNRLDFMLTRSVVEVAKEMGLKTVAEHIETAAVEKTLKELGVDYGQGYHLGRPCKLV